VIEGQDWAGYQSSTPSTKGLAFVFVKATEGRSFVNDRHDVQVAHARAAGLVVGHYHFMRPGPPTGQAAYFLDHARPRPGDLLACDWEDEGVSIADKNAFMRAVKRARPDLREVLYANLAFWHRDSTSYCADGLWIADPSAPKSHPRVVHPWLFHQYSEAGGLDRNVGNFADRAALVAWAAGTEEDDPMAGMTPQQIYDAVWRTDRMPAPSDSPQSNPTWTTESGLRDVQARLRAIQATEAAQSAAIAALAGLAGAEVDTAAVVAAVRDAIAQAVVHVQVDVTGATPEPPTT